MSDCQCVIAKDTDISYIASLQDDNREAVGHLPKERLLQQISKHRVTIGRINGEPFGYMLCHGKRDLIVSQACIQYDARRKLYGAQLAEFSFSAFTPERIRLRCASDLEANLFWKAMGFTCVGHVPGGRRRGRTINVWIRWIQHGLFQLGEIDVQPVAQIRVDCKYDTTDYLGTVPNGFTDGGQLEKLAWKADY